jgi:hypothetical protein
MWSQRERPDVPSISAPAEFSPTMAEDPIPAPR